ncbi:hypothetical protein D3C77_794820 [compost metagenome]
MSAKRCGIASVVTMELLTGTISFASAGIVAAQALTASTTERARRLAWAVFTKAGWPGSMSLTPVPS